MASERPSRIILSKTDMTAIEVAALSDAEAWRIIYATKTVRTKDERPHVCLTGFGATRKAELARLGADGGLRVVTTVTKNLQILVAGENAGPKKIAAAHSCGAEILTEDEFRSLLSGGASSE